MTVSADARLRSAAVAAVCPNCGACAPEQFCARCGQQQRSLDLSIWDLLKEHLQDAFNLEGRLFRTVRVMSTRPGALTRDYLSGKRTRYTHPVRLYLVMSAVFFATYLFTRPIDAAFFGYVGGDSPGRVAAMARGLLLSVPVLALVMKLLYVRRRRHLIEHVIFLFHLGTAGLTGVWIALLLATAHKLLWKSETLAPFHPGWFYLFTFGGFAVYLVLSLRTVYSEHVLQSLWKGVLLLLVLIVLVLNAPSIVESFA